MSRQKFFPENRDSDQSISDEEDFVCNWLENSRSVCLSGKEEEWKRIPTNLELHRGCEYLPCGGIFGPVSDVTKTSESLEPSFHLEDEVQIPVFHNERSFIQAPRMAFSRNSDEEGISEEEVDNKNREISVHSESSLISGANKLQKGQFHDSQVETQGSSGTWSAVLKEADELACLHERSVSTSSRVANPEPRRIDKGNRCKPKCEFSVRLHLHEGEPSRHCMVTDVKEKSIMVHQMAEKSEDTGHIIRDHSMTELLEGLEEEKETHSEMRQVPADLIIAGHRNREHSISELLEDLQEKNDLLKETFRMESRTKARRLLIAAQRNVSPLGDRTLDNEDPPEPMASRPSSDDELNLAIPDVKRETIADRFQEALSAASLDDGITLVGMSKQSGNGYFGRLQQLIQSEKERHTEFLNQIQRGVSPHDKARCINVKILSRYLDAKLIVCHCSFGENTKNAEWTESSQNNMSGGGREKTVIFSSRICGHVELEVGNSVRLHPPWKEVQVMGNEESIILCAYFSHIGIC